MSVKMTKIFQYRKFLRPLKAYPDSSFSESSIIRHISISCKCQTSEDDFFGIEEFAKETRDNKSNYYEQNKGQRQHESVNKMDADMSSDLSKSNFKPERNYERKASRPSSRSGGNQEMRITQSKFIDKSVENRYKEFRNSSTKEGSDFIDDQYFNVQNRTRTADQESRRVRSPGFKDNHRPSKSSRSGSSPDFDFIDKQYFGNSEKETDKSAYQKSSDYEENIGRYNRDRGHMDYIDDQYFGTQSKEQSSGQSVASNKMETKSKSAYDSAMEIRKNLKFEIQNFGADDKKSEKLTENEVKSRFEGPVDSKGFRILKYQTQDLMNEPEGIVVDVLKKNVIYNEGDIIAINKPYGLPSHGGPGVKFSVGGLLPQLAHSLYPDKSLQTLHLIHRLDKETTGVMLLAKRAAVAEELRECFVKRKVIKKYWAITKGIPDPVEGVIKIPITEGSLSNGIHRMILKPEYNRRYGEVMKKRNLEEAQEAITQYKIFKQHQSAALIECQPISGVKHQIRCHLGFGLNTPILGDHKYSHFNKLAPQRLPPDMLTLLGIRQSKVRHVPMHLHAKSILIPEFKDGQNFMVSAKLPKHFLINLRRLKLN